MAMRVKNIAMGFTDSSGFHPVRSSADYDRAGDDYSQRPAARRKKKATGRKPKPGAHRVRKKNPIPTTWVKANVKRVGNDIQVMLFPRGKVAKRRAKRRKAGRVARRRNPQAGVIQFSARARCWGALKTNKFRVDSDGTVRAWDSVAGHYTIHHGMTKREESRIRNMARRRQ